MSVRQFTLLVTFCLAATLHSPGVAAQDNPVVIIETNLGTITAELDGAKAPLSVENFLQYANSGFYNGTVFHRVIPGFMIQGGGLTADLQRKPGTHAPIKNEATNGLENLRGTLSMARTNAVDSATAQFFINTGNNTSLNNRGTAPDTYGYAVFGRVTEGIEVVDKIEGVPTGARGPHRNVPNTPVEILSVTVR